MSETWHGLPFSWSRLFTRVRWGGGGPIVIKRGPFRSEVVRFV